MKIKRLVMLLILLIAPFGIFGCTKNDDFNENCVSEFRIYIKGEYKSKFVNKEFQESDFKYDNLGPFTYGNWIEEDKMGYMTIYLNDYSNNEINKAMSHFKKLKFVKKCERIMLNFLDNRVLITIKDEYKSKYQNKEFRESDFKYDNLLEFSYSWDSLEKIQYIYIDLKKPGRSEVKKALRYFKKNKYVKEVSLVSSILL